MLLESDKKEVNVKFGLPEKVLFCKRCVLSNQRPSSVHEHTAKTSDKKPTIAFDEKGVCCACNFAEFKRQIDWDARESQLLKLLDRHRSKDGSYDVIIPGSGGKDSCYTAFVLKSEYGMHPLTLTWAPHMYTDVGWRNLQNWIHSGFDNMLITPNGKAQRLITKLAFENLVHPFQPFIIGQANLAPKMAVRLNIPLVFYGENGAEYGNTSRDAHSPLRPFPTYTADPYLGGVSYKKLIERNMVNQGDLDIFLPPSPEELKRVGVECHFLGYYKKWSQQENYYLVSEKMKFEANPDGRSEGTYSKYVGLDDKVDGFHFYTTFIKFGIGRATYDAAQEIRDGRITREEGVALVNRYDGEFPKKYFKDFLGYIDITEERFFELIDSCRSPHLWEKTSSGWKLKYQVS
jgi:N-acetyl sugar amidotransferase